MRSDAAARRWLEARKARIDASDAVAELKTQFGGGLSFAAAVAQLGLTTDQLERLDADAGTFMPAAVAAIEAVLDIADGWDREAAETTDGTGADLTEKANLLRAEIAAQLEEKSPHSRPKNVDNRWQE